MDNSPIRWKTLHSKCGFPFQVVEPDLPRIPDDFLECVVYLYPSEAAAEDGEAIGGSGFLYGVRIRPDNTHMLTFVVTNKHIVDGGSQVVRINKKDGAKDIIPLDGAKWYYHPDGDDIAICPLVGLRPDLHRAKAVVEGSTVRKFMVEHFDIGIGDDVFFIGRFINHEGGLQNNPSVRFGNISQMPGEPIIIDTPKGKFEQESYLIEGKSIPGYSGSPVFIVIPPTDPDWTIDGQVVLKRNPRNKSIPDIFGPFLLGINFCHIRSKEKIYSELTGRSVNDDWYVSRNTGMMGVIPVWRIIEVIESPDVAKIIEKVTNDLAKRRASSHVSLDGVATHDHSSDENPTHREDFKSLLSAASKTPSQGN